MTFKQRAAPNLFNGFFSKLCIILKMLRIANYAVSRNQYCISTKTEVRNGRCQSLKALLFLSRERTLILYSLADEDTVLTSFPPFFYMWWGESPEYRQSIKDDIGQIYRHDANAIPYILGRIYHLFSNLMIGKPRGITKNKNYYYSRVLI